MEKFFGEDVVALKADPSITGIVTATWRDLESVNPLPLPDDWVTHSDVPDSIRQEYLETGLVPDHHAIVEFIPPFCGTAIVGEDALVLLDRGICVGDVVKQKASDSQSGTVTNARVRCRIQPVYAQLPYSGSQPWPHQPEDNEIWVPVDELRDWDYRERDYVSFKGWIGEIVRVKEEVAVRLGNGTVVRVRDDDELESPAWAGDYRLMKRRWLENKSLVQNLHRVRAMITETNEREAMWKPELIYPGLEVQTKKSNLRLGSWVIGQYTASQPAKGIVVETRAVELAVDWVTTDLHDPNTAGSEPPDTVITTSELDKIRLCDLQLPSSPYGSRVARIMLAGDMCRFRDEPGAALKYSEEDTNGRFRRIPRDLTQGFNMNVFRVVETRTQLEIQWQDGTKTEMDAKSATPYVNIDEHDLWPGEIVSIKDMETEEEGTIKAGKLGIIQSVDAKERTADVRWFIAPNVACLKDELSTLIPGGDLGQLAQEVAAVSVYDVIEYPALSKHRGDIVLISPAARNGVVWSEESMFPNAGGITSNNHPVADESVTANTVGAIPSNGEARTEPSTAQDLPWVGEVVDLGLDGMLTVRLGAVSPPRDIKARADQLVMLVSVDDENILDTENPDESMDELETDDGSMEGVVEEISYEGGQRLDNGDEDAWMTDSSGDEKQAAAIVSPKPAVPSEDVTEAQAVPTNIAPSASSEDSIFSIEQPEYHFNEFANMPAQFEILDSPPIDHYFQSHQHSWNTPGALRRIRKEHKLLQSSLPRGIWVRTWADRLDLLRILIVGPKGTPYALAPFVFDFAFSSDYPKNPPEAFFYSWTNSVGRINPNLYEDGKVCLSILGTWPGSEKTESWNPEHSSMLQVLVSLLGLVLVEKPYYNEAGFEHLMGVEDSVVNDRIYSEKALVMSKGFVVRALKDTPTGLEDVIKWIYTDEQGPRLLKWVVEEAQKLRAQANDSSQEKLSKGALILLERHLPTLEAMNEG